MSDPYYMPRRLSWFDDKGNLHKELEGDILDRFSQPLIVLGDPGLGKTRLMEKLGEQNNCRFVRAAAFLRWRDRPIDDDRRLVIDGLDEVAAAQEGDPLHNFLKKLSDLGKPRFVLSCRSAEWKNVTASVDIEDDYTAKPMVLTLEPLSEDEAAVLLSNGVASDKAEEAIDRLKDQGLAKLYQNPLTLNFIKAIVQEKGEIPEGRADLYEKAVTQLRLEQNDRHKTSHLASLSLDQALDAAGAAMATLLITGHQAITKGHDNNALQLSEIADFGDADKIRAILGSNLFRTDTVNGAHVLPLHRTVAEFLAARWLGRKIETHPHPDRAASRLIGLLSAEGGIPASLRGMAAWLPKFSPEYLGPGIIEMDPYAVLRYGDGDGLLVEQGRAMISSLASLSEFDPFFRSDHLDSFSAKGLVHKELQADLQELILNQEASPQLRSIILECLKGSGTAKLLKDDLQAIAMDSDRSYNERFVSADALNDLDESLIDGSMIMRLIALGDQNSTRLAVETMTDTVESGKFAPKLIAEAVITNSRFLEEPEQHEHSLIFGSYYRLGKKISDNQIIPFLDELTARVLPTRDPEKWWDYSYGEGWMEFCQLVDRLINRQLDNKPSAVRPKQLWDWMCAFRGERIDFDDAIANILAEEDQLRQAIQRLALFAPGTEEKFFFYEYHLERLSGGLILKNSDCKIHLTELVSRENPDERELWKTLAGRFRGDDGYIPKDIQAIARPYAGDDKELLNFLTRKPKKRPLEDGEKKERRRTRERQKRREKNNTKLREKFTKNIAAMQSGELGWIMNPAKAYLGMYKDLDQKAEPEARVTEWLGDELCDAALVGFEAVLNREDIPSAKQVAESATKSQVWNFIFPMLAGAGRRMRQNIPLHDLSADLVSALAIGAEQQLREQGWRFDGLQDRLVNELRERPDDQYEKYLRQRFEPFFEAKSTHNFGLYGFTHSEDERPLSSQLCAEWLERYSELPLEIERELAGCLVNAKNGERNAAWLHLQELANSRLEDISNDEDRRKYWLSILYMVDFDRAVDEIPSINNGNRDLLWLLSHNFYQRHGDRAPASASINQLYWIIEKFRRFWPHTDRPNGVTSGDHNPWDATQLLEWAIFKIAADPSELATSLLIKLRDMPEDGYTIHVQAAIARQHRARLESRFRNPLSIGLKAVLDDDPPKSSADVQAIVLEQLVKLQKKLQGDPLNIVNNFYDGQKPKTEDKCRDQMLIALGELPFGIQSPPEAAMPQGKRGDAAFSYQDIAVPLEAKGQWHKGVWAAASTQLDRLYASDYRAASKGIYVVFWFGPNAPAGKRLKKPPAGTANPETAKEMRAALQESIPAHRQGDIKVVVLDLTRP